MSQRPQVIRLCVNAEGFHNVFALRNPRLGEHTQEQISKQAFEPNNLRGAVDAAVTLMETHQISLVAVVDPGKKLLTTSTRSNLNKRQMRALAAGVPAPKG